MPAQLGQHHQLQVLVLELERLVAHHLLTAGEVLAQGVGVVELRDEQVEGRVDVGRAFLVRGQVDRALGDPDLSGATERRREEERENEGRGGPHGFHHAAPAETPAAEASSRKSVAWA